MKLIQKNIEGGMENKQGLTATLLGIAIGGGLAYWIHENYWDKSIWGKIGTVWFGLGAIYGIISLTGAVPSVSELAQRNTAPTENAPEKV